MLNKNILENNKIILVEGESEYRFFSIFLERLNVDLNIYRTSILKVNGKSQFLKYLEILKEHNVKFLIIFDNDSDKNINERNNKRLSKFLGIKIFEIEKNVYIYKRFEKPDILIFENNIEFSLKKDILSYLKQNDLEFNMNSIYKNLKNFNDKPSKLEYITKSILNIYENYTPEFLYDIVHFIVFNGE